MTARRTLMISRDDHRRFGTTGLMVPPIAFGAAALGNARRVVPDQTKLAICGEWLRHVEPPILIDTGGDCGGATALAILRRAFDRLEVSPADAIISHELGWRRALDEGVRLRAAQVLQSWERDCQLLGGKHLPQLLAINRPDKYLALATSPADRQRRFRDVLDAYGALYELKAACQVVAVGIAARDWRVVKEIAEAVAVDWVKLSHCCTVMRHAPELVAFMTSLAERQVPIVSSGVFEGGFLVGAQHLDNRALNRDNAADRSPLAWRKSFVALCEGHGLSPAHACIQFGLSAPGVVAVGIDTTYPDRVAENVKSVLTPVPDTFWAAMREEGLLAA